MIGQSPSPWSALREQFSSGLAHAWHVFQPWGALYCLPGVVGALVLGLTFDQRGAALLAAAGAFSAGFGAFHRLGSLRALPMIMAALCMSVSTAVGTVASGHAALDVLLVGAAALSLGMAGAFGTGFWWVLLQGAVFLVIAGAHPGAWSDGSVRGLLVLLGGLGQALIITLLRRAAPAGFPHLPAPNLVATPTEVADWIGRARQVVSPHAPELAYGLVLGAASAAAILVADGLSLPNGYWAALTVLLVLRRGGTETLVRGAQRVGGTVLGAAAATWLAAVLRPDAPELVALIAGAAWCAYATQWVNYGTFSLSITSYVAFLLALLGAPEAEVAVHRIAATLLGAGVSGVALLLLIGVRHVTALAPLRRRAAPR